jgi:hypothetical protein
MGGCEDERRGVSCRVLGADPSASLEAAKRQTQVRTAVAEALGLDEEAVERARATFDRVKRDLREAA